MRLMFYDTIIFPLLFSSCFGVIGHHVFYPHLSPCIYISCFGNFFCCFFLLLFFLQKRAHVDVHRKANESTSKLKYCSNASRWAQCFANNKMPHSSNGVLRCLLAISCSKLILWSYDSIVIVYVFINLMQLNFDTFNLLEIVWFACVEKMKQQQQQQKKHQRWWATRSYRMWRVNAVIVVVSMHIQVSQTNDAWSFVLNRAEVELNLGLMKTKKKNKSFPNFYFIAAV